MHLQNLFVLKGTTVEDGEQHDSIPIFWSNGSVLALDSS